MKVLKGRGGGAVEKVPRKYKGVFSAGKKYKAQIASNGVQNYLGSFDSEEEAARCYDDHAIRILGPNARTNFVYESMEDQIPSAKVNEAINMTAKAAAEHRARDVVRIDGKAHKGPSAYIGIKQLRKIQEGGKFIPVVSGTSSSPSSSSSSSLAKGSKFVSNTAPALPTPSQTQSNMAFNQAPTSLPSLLTGQYLSGQSPVYGGSGFSGDPYEYQWAALCHQRMLLQQVNAALLRMFPMHMDLIHEQMNIQESEFQLAQTQRVAAAASNRGNLHGQQTQLP